MIKRLSSIPTLRQLYANGILHPKAGVKATAEDKYLDVITLMYVKSALYHYTSGSRKKRQGDITKLEVDAIVNAANKSLLGQSYVRLFK